MKKNEMNPFFIYLLVVITFLIMTIVVVFLQNNLVTIVCLFLLMIAFLFPKEMLSKNRNRTNSVHKPSGRG